MELEHDLAGVFGRVWETTRENRQTATVEEFSTPKDVLNAIIEADESVDSKIAALENFVLVSNEILYGNPQGINRLGAAALEDYATGILPARASVNSFTQLHSSTNYTVALEAVDGKIVAMIGAFLAAIVALISKFIGWSSNKAENIEAKVEEGSKGLSPEEKKKAKEVLVAYDDYMAETDDGRKLSLHDLQMDILTNHYGKGSKKAAVCDMWVLSDTLKGNGNSKAIKFYEHLNRLAAFLEGQAKLLIFATVDFAKEVKKAEFRHVDIDDRIMANITALEVSAANIVRDSIHSSVEHLKRTGFPYDWSAVDKILKEEEGAAKYGPALKQFFDWFRLNRDILFESADGTTASDFPNDLLINIVKYTDAVAKALKTPAFDTSEWEGIKAGGKAEQVTKKVEKLEADITAATKHFDLRDNDGNLMAPSSAKIMPAVKQAMSSYRTLISLAAGCMNQVDEGAALLYDWSAHLVPDLLNADKLFRQDYEEYKKKLAERAAK